MVNFNLNKTKSILFLEQISRNASNSRQILQNLVKDFRSLSSEEQKDFQQLLLDMLDKTCSFKKIKIAQDAESKVTRPEFPKDIFEKLLWELQDKPSEYIEPRLEMMRACLSFPSGKQSKTASSAIQEMKLSLSHKGFSLAKKRNVFLRCLYETFLLQELYNDIDE